MDLTHPWFLSWFLSSKYCMDLAPTSGPDPRAEFMQPFTQTCNMFTAQPACNVYRCQISPFITKIP